MSEIDVQPMVEAHQPGWRHGRGDGSQFMLWAPRDTAPLGGRPRAEWAAHWSSPDGWDCDHRKGATAEDALQVLDTYPDKRYARRVRQALLVAAGFEPSTGGTDR